MSPYVIFARQASDEPDQAYLTLLNLDGRELALGRHCSWRVLSHPEPKPDGTPFDILGFYARMMFGEIAR
jgi:hypothetical protein